MCLLLFPVLTTLDQLQLCPEMAEPLILPCYRVDSRGITGVRAAAAASEATLLPLPRQQKGNEGGGFCILRAISSA